jgi:hypothetical protein
MCEYNSWYVVLAWSLAFHVMPFFDISAILGCMGMCMCRRGTGPRTTVHSSQITIHNSQYEYVMWYVVYHAKHQLSATFGHISDIAPPGPEERGRFSPGELPRWLRMPLGVIPHRSWTLPRGMEHQGLEYPSIPSTANMLRTETQSRSSRQGWPFSKIWKSVSPPVDPSLTTGDIESSRPLSATIHGVQGMQRSYSYVRGTRTRISRNDILIPGYFPW